ncbi:DUF6452 family protein [Ulvibacter litoralis]|uniref:Lipoprotein n=1 Tax=Ulvibacter litoralis TaxID=227084 RepID=A0A1G7FVU3_9FLAO|nr:DUF6452 family protein [Ulvibacter litoralis]GHC64073.1 hypothetical protein GCM10008083_31700 [Ulvibacter litoralis]SDE79999.1 hypothetical protein SAMN05421855_102811 [Ulvibacter litoralis]
MYKKLIVILVILTTLYGCTKDDICPEGTVTTPLLIINFKDNANPTLLKDVDSLTVETNYDSSVLVYSQVTTDSISISLRPGEETTEYRFIKYAGESNEVIDIYSFSYDHTNIYINRACGFKATYSNLSAEKIDTNSNNWITNTQIIKTTVEDETEAHITFFH